MTTTKHMTQDKLPSRTGTRGAAALTALYLLLGGVRAAAAQPATSGARTHFAIGQQALSQGNLERATQELEQAYVQESDREALRLLGDISSRQRAETAAADLYRRYIAESMPLSPSPELLQKVAAAEQSAAEIAVDGPEGAVLRVDGRLAGRLPLAAPLLLTEGTHELLVQDRDRRQLHRAKASAEVPLRIIFPRRTTELVVQEPATVVLVLYEEQAAEGAGLAQGVRRALRRSGQLHAISEERTARALGRAPKGCLADPACRREFARRLQARYIIEANRAVPGAQLTVEVFDVEVGQIGGRSTVDCKGCAGGSEPFERAVEAAVGQALSQPHGALRVTSQPRGAAIYLDGNPLNLRTPQSFPVFAGQHQLMLRADYHLSKVVSVSVDAGATQALDLSLPVNTAAVQKRRLAIGKWVVLGAGALAVIGGVSAMAVNRTSREDPETPKLLSWPYGAASLALGGALLASAVGLWAGERSAERRARDAER